MKQYEVINGVPVHRVFSDVFKNKYLNQIVAGFNICRILWKFRNYYDIVHGFSTNIFYIPVFVFSKLLGKPVVLDFTIMASKNVSMLQKILYHISFFIFRAMDAYIAISTPLLQQMVEMGLPKSKCHLIPVGVYTDIFFPADATRKSELRDKLNLDPNSFYLIFVGSFIQRKGVDTLIEIMDYLMKFEHDIHLIIVGQHEFPEGHSYQSFADRMKSIIKNNRLSNRIRFIGLIPTDEVVQWLQACDIFIFPSRREGMPRVIVEAMSVGLPCICSDLERIVFDLIVPGISGIIVESDDPSVYGEEIIKLIYNASYRIQLGKEARLVVVNKFDEKKLAIAYRNVFESLLPLSIE